MALDRITGEILFPVDYNALEQAFIGTGWLGSGWACTGSVSDLSVDVTAGKGMAAGAIVKTASPTNVPLAAAHASLPRKDLIIWDASGGVLAKVDGTAVAVAPVGETNPRKMKYPAPPDLPATDDIILAVVYVPAAETHGSDCTIIDKRVQLPFVYLPSSAQGDIWHHDGDGIKRLAPGTAGYVLATLGAGADPAWAYRCMFATGSYTGNSSANRAIPHGLGVIPRIVIIQQQTDTSSMYWNMIIQGFAYIYDLHASSGSWYTQSNLLIQQLQLWTAPTFMSK